VTGRLSAHLELNDPTLTREVLAAIDGGTTAWSEWPLRVRGFSMAIWVCGNRARNIQWGGRALFNRAADSRNNRRIFLL